MARRMINGDIEIGNTNISLKNLVSHGYGTYRFRVFTLNSSTTSKIGFIPIRTTGRPVFLICTGDMNPTGDSWMSTAIYRDGTLLRSDTCQGSADSYNKPFNVSYLDYPPAGSHEYRVQFILGRGTITCGEESDAQAPVFSAIEI